MLPKSVAAIFCLCALSACARTEAVRMSQNTLFVKTSAAPVCGSTGALRVAQAMAAVETIRAGYDRYIIADARAQNTVTATQMPGSYVTTGTYGGGYYSASTTYQPGPVIWSGSHDQGFMIVMFKEDSEGAQQAVSAREILGPDWQNRVKSGINTCW